MRLIDADKLDDFKIEDVMGCVDLPYREFQKAFRIGWNNAIIEIKMRAPTAKKAGHWKRAFPNLVYYPTYCYVCSECGMAFPFEMPYCGECGAEMMGVENGNDT